MENTRLKVKVGVHEFDAEGPAEQVSAQFTAWKELIALTPSHQPATTTGPAAGTPTPQRQSDPAPSDEHLDLFVVDDSSQTITLKAHPQGEDRDSDAALLTLYGYRRCLSVDEVLVGKLKDSLELTGLRPERIDRIVDGYIRQGLLLKTGRGPGGKYRLSYTGMQRAESIAKRLFEQLA